ncbi:MAG: DNA-processing protein DprA [Vicinamibacteria bacterium]
MEEHTLRLLTLMTLPGFGPHKIASLFRAGGVNELYEGPRRFAAQLGELALQALEGRSARQQAELIYKDACRKGQSMVALGDAGYPSSLAAIYDPPPVLFFKGSFSDRRRVAIVGARAATGSGRSLARDLARGLAAAGLEVVSGLARGIDGSAHEGALSGNGTTLAVLGSSVDIIYPAEHELLAGRIEGHGAVISEFIPGTRPSPPHFPRRNRIIVGLSEAVILIEAGNRSGALITARLALDEGRDVLAVPGRPGDPLSYGPNLMIRDGATLIRSLDDVLEHLGLGVNTPTKKSPARDPVLEKLGDSVVKSVNQLALDTGLAPSDLIARLSELELDGKIERLPGTLFRSASPA